MYDLSRKKPVFARQLRPIGSILQRQGTILPQRSGGFGVQFSQTEQLLGTQLRQRNLRVQTKAQNRRCRTQYLFQLPYKGGIRGLAEIRQTANSPLKPQLKSKGFQDLRPGLFQQPLPGNQQQVFPGFPAGVTQQKKPSALRFSLEDHVHRRLPLQR